MQYYLNGFRPGDPDIREPAPGRESTAGRTALPETVDVLIAGSLLALLTLVVAVSGVWIWRRGTEIEHRNLDLNAANLALVAFNRHHFSPAWRTMDGQIYAFLIIVIAAAEVAVGLAIIVALFKHRTRVDIDEINFLKR